MRPRERLVAKDDSMRLWKGMVAKGVCEVVEEDVVRFWKRMVA